jgi:hypothetical protein
LGLAVVGLGVAADCSGDAAVTLPPPLELDDMLRFGICAKFVLVVCPKARSFSE